MRIPTANYDSRAAYRDTFDPAVLTIEMMPVMSTARLIGDAVNADIIPAVVVLKDGTIWQMTAGGSGVIWVQGSGRFTAEQRDALDDITAAFEAAWPHLAKPDNLTGTVQPETPKKRKPRKKAAPKPQTVEEVTEEVADAADDLLARSELADTNPMVPPWTVPD